MTRGRTARPDDPPAGVIRRCPDLPMSQWATSPKSVQNREEEQNARHGREPWDSRVLQELPCVPIPRANMMNAVPGYVPGVGSRPGFDYDAGTLFVGNHINTGLLMYMSHNCSNQHKISDIEYNTRSPTAHCAQLRRKRASGSAVAALCFTPRTPSPSWTHPHCTQSSIAVVLIGPCKGVCGSAH